MSYHQVTPKDWPEDFPHENGNYLCRCLGCGEQFTGYKRRVTCKECMLKNVTQEIEQLRIENAHLVTQLKSAEIKAEIKDGRRYTPDLRCKTCGGDLNTGHKENCDYYKVSQCRDDLAGRLAALGGLP